MRRGALREDDNMDELKRIIDWYQYSKSYINRKIRSDNVGFGTLAYNV